MPLTLNQSWLSHIYEGEKSSGILDIKKSFSNMVRRPSTNATHITKNSGHSFPALLIKRSVQPKQESMPHVYEWNSDNDDREEAVTTFTVLYSLCAK